MIRSGKADLPLHGGKVPPWLAERMAKLGLAITESILREYGKKQFIERMSDPLWFQSLGCVLGMDWHSSGITTSVLGALKKAINPHSHALGIYICGGRGKQSLKTPQELNRVADKTGLPGNELVRSSKLTAKIDNTAIQDGYQLYLHSFILSNDGDWSVVQQGMNNQNGMARRYHWCSSLLTSYVETPHTAVCGTNKGQILNLTAKDASITREGILALSKNQTQEVLKESRQLLMPRHHDVRAYNVDLKRLGAVLNLAYENQPAGFEDLLLIKGLGPRTLQSLTLVSEVIHGTPSRFTDPARFSFAHGGKDGHPFPVPTKVYDETIEQLSVAVSNARIGITDKSKAIKKLYTMAESRETSYHPDNQKFKQIINHERAQSHQFGGRTVFGRAKKQSGQLLLFQ